MLVMLFITCPIASRRMITSEKPMRGAGYRTPLEMKMTLIVPRLTSQVRARKIRRGRRIHVKSPDDMITSAMTSTLEAGTLKGVRERRD